MENTYSVKVFQLNGEPTVEEFVGHGARIGTSGALEFLDQNENVTSAVRDWIWFQLVEPPEDYA